MTTLTDELYYHIGVKYYIAYEFARIKLICIQ